MSSLSGSSMGGQSPAAGLEGRAGPLRILIVEDNLDSAEALHTLLRLWGYEAHVAYDGPAGLAAVGELKPDVVLLDIGLPGMDGFQVADTLCRRGGPRPLLVALTGYSQPQDRERARQVGIDHYFTKPVDLQALRSLLASV